MEPFSASAVFAGINSCFKFAEYAVRIAEVGTENEVFVRTINVVRTDLCEVERLIAVPSIQSKLIATPAKLQWIKSAIHSTKSALNEIGKWVERARVDQQAFGTVKFETRVRWVFNDHEKLLNRQHELSMCHQQLSNVLGYLVPLEDAAVTSAPPMYADATSFDDILAPRRRRKAVSNAALTSEWNTTKSTPPASLNCASTAPPSNFTNLAISPEEESLPSSPPPSYATITRAQDKQLLQRVTDPTYPIPTLNPYQPPMFSDDKRKGGAMQMPKQEVWAYEHTETVVEAVPELHGNSFNLGATNTTGPVDPFELFGSTTFQPTSDSQRAPAAQRHHFSAAPEMLGDTDFRVELPADFPNAQKSTTPAIVPEMSANQYRNLGQHMAFGENYQNYAQTVYQPTASGGSVTNVPHLGGSTTPQVAELYTAARRYDSAPEVVPKQMEQPTVFERRNLPNTLGSAISPPPHCYPTSSSQSHCSPTSPNSEPYSSRRMRNQKTFMDMLGGLDGG